MGILSWSLVEGGSKMKLFVAFFFLLLLLQSQRLRPMLMLLSFMEDMATQVLDMLVLDIVVLDMATPTPMELVSLARGQLMLSPRLSLMLMLMLLSSMEVMATLVLDTLA